MKIVYDAKVLKYFCYKFKKKKLLKTIRRNICCKGGNRARGKNPIISL